MIKVAVMTDLHVDIVHDAQFRIDTFIKRG